MNRLNQRKQKGWVAIYAFNFQFLHGIESLPGSSDLNRRLKIDGFVLFP